MHETLASNDQESDSESDTENELLSLDCLLNQDSDNE